MMQKQDFQVLTPARTKTVLEDAIRSHAAGEIDAAISLYTQILQSADPPCHVYQNLISCLRSKKKLTEGLHVASAGLSKYPNDPSILLNQGNILLDLKRHSQAFHSFRLSLSIDSTSVSSLLGMTASLRALKLPCLAYRSLLSFYVRSDKSTKGKLLPHLLSTAIEINSQYPDLQSQSESLISSLQEHIDEYKPTSLSASPLRF